MTAETDSTPKTWHPERPEWEKGELIEPWWNVLDYLAPDSRIWFVRGGLVLEADGRAHRIVMPPTPAGWNWAFRAMRSWIQRGV